MYLNFINYFYSQFILKYNCLKLHCFYYLIKFIPTEVKFIYLIIIKVFLILNYFINFQLIS